MAVPADTKVFLETLDPRDIVEFEVGLAPLLEVGENIASTLVTLPTESALLGLEIKITGGYATTVTNNVMRLWLGVIPAEQANVAFVSGATLPIEIEITTDSTPPRRKQRTVGIVVKQR